MGELDEGLRDLLIRLKTDPDGLSFRPPRQVVPLDLQFAARQYLFNRLEGDLPGEFQPRKLERIFRYEVAEGNLERKLRDFYRRLCGMGLANSQHILRMFLYYIDSEILGMEPEFVSSLDKPIFQTTVRPHRGPDSLSRELQYWLYLIEYAQQTNLAYWTGEQWRITALGELFLKSSSLQGVHFLLTLETYLSGGRYDEYRMPRGFLSKLHELDAKGVFIDPSEMRKQFLMSGEYLERLEMWGLLESVHRDQTVRPRSRRYQLTKVGAQIIQGVISPSSRAVESVIRVLIDQQLAWSVGELPSADSHQLLADLSALVDSSRLIGDQKEKLMAAIRSYQDGNYVSTHLSMIPSVEGILRNLAQAEEIHGLPARPTLWNCLEKLKAMSIISESTFAWVVSLDRNGVLHANLNPSEEMDRPLSEMVMHVVRAIHKDYQTYQQQKAGS